MFSFLSGLFKDEPLEPQITSSKEEYMGCSDEQLELRKAFFHFVAAYKKNHEYFHGTKCPPLYISEMMDDFLSFNESWINASPIAVTYFAGGNRVSVIVRGGDLAPSLIPRSLDGSRIFGVEIKVQRNG